MMNLPGTNKRENNAHKKVLVGLFFIFLYLGISQIPAYSETVAEVFEIHYSEAEKLQETVRPLLSEQGRVSVAPSTNALVVLDKPEVIQRIRWILAQIDRKPKQIRIQVDFVEKERLKEYITDVNWRAGKKGWSVGSPLGSHKNHAGMGFSIGTQRQSSKKSQFLLLRENLPGRIFVGEEVPHASYYLQYGHRHGYLAPNVTFKKAGTSFSVTARRAGKGKLHINLQPEVSYYDREEKSFSVKNASTALVVDDPGTVVLGGSDGQDGYFNANFMRGVNNSNATSNFVMILKVRSEK